MSTNLVLLAILMFAVTYPTRAVGLLTPGWSTYPRPVPAQIGVRAVSIRS